MVESGFASELPRRNPIVPSVRVGKLSDTLGSDWARFGSGATRLALAIAGQRLNR